MRWLVGLGVGLGWFATWGASCAVAQQSGTRSSVTAAGGSTTGDRGGSLGARPVLDPEPWIAGRAALDRYLARQAQLLADRDLADIETQADWLAHRDRLRDQLREMLGLDPLPPKTDLQAVITGTIEQPEFVVEKLHFQSLPGLYVTGNLYRPREQAGPLPAILYVCGHSRQKEGSTSFGNKTGYQHHGAWFARHGFVCLTIDTIQLGEIEGVHHGTHNLNQWWWNARGYTPAGVEAWNGIRALDYLQSRPEVDGERLGVTGRSGGGAYSWWIAALDDRVKAAVPVAGITDLRNHVVDGVVDGHCDCMYHINTYRWDFATIAALVAPRPLLIANTDKDTIFPLEGVVRVHAGARRIYRLLEADKNLGLLLTEGPHQDTQDLQVPAFRWFQRFLKPTETPLVERAAVKQFTPAELKVFAALPADERVTRIAESFVPQAATPPVPATREEFEATSAALRGVVRQKVFGGWPESLPVIARWPQFDAVAEGVRVRIWRWESERNVPLVLVLAQPADRPITGLQLNLVETFGWQEVSERLRSVFPHLGAVADEERSGDVPRDGAQEGRLAEGARVVDPDWWTRIAAGELGKAWLAPRGFGPSAWSKEGKIATAIRRRFQLLGQTVDGMQVWDTIRGVQWLKGQPGLGDLPLELRGANGLAGQALYAAWLEPGVSRLRLSSPPTTHREGPDLLNVLRFTDVPQVLAMVADRIPVELADAEPRVADYAKSVGRVLQWPEGRLQVWEGGR